MEPVFQDNTTDFGSGPNEWEANWITAFHRDGKGHGILENSLELEYTLFDRFGMEAEISHVHRSPGRPEEKDNDWSMVELAAQYICYRKGKTVLATGAGAGIPLTPHLKLDNENMEAETYVVVAHRPTPNLTLQARVGPVAEQEGGRTEFGVSWQGAALYSYRRFFFGTEASNGQGPGAGIWLSPQLGAQFGVFTIALGLGWEATGSGKNFNTLLRIVCEL